MGIYFIAAGNSSRNREKSLDKSFTLKEIEPYLKKEHFEKIIKYINRDEPAYIWGANTNAHNQLNKVRLGEYVVDVENADVVQVLTFCCSIRTFDHRLQEFIGWDNEKPKEKRRPFEYVFFLKKRQDTNNKKKKYYQYAFGFNNNSHWLDGQKYFDDSLVKAAIVIKGSKNIEEFLGINKQ
jgi:hypothetical protein